MKHTPGPWNVNFLKFSEVRAENGLVIAICKPVDSLVTLQANAQLMAASPILLDIARRLAGIAEGLRNGNSSAEEYACRIADEALEIVAKLKGGVR